MDIRLKQKSRCKCGSPRISRINTTHHRLNSSLSYCVIRLKQSSTYHTRTVSKESPVMSPALILNGSFSNWQLNPRYCDQCVKNTKLFATGRRLLHMVDKGIFDFLISACYDLFFIYHL